MDDLKPKDEIAKKYRLLLGNPYALLDGKGNFTYDIDSVQENILATSQHRPTLAEIEGFAKSIQEVLWRNREKIWLSGIPNDKVKILDPLIAMELLGYTIEHSDSLDLYSKNDRDSEVAAIIDQSKKHLRLSRKFKSNVQRFTAAHELGHAVMHNQARLHRDRPLHRPNTLKNSRNSEEFEADKFATFFLLPEGLVRSRFESKFGSKLLKLSRELVFDLDPAGSSNLTRSKLTLRDFSVALAKCENFKGKKGPSLASQFGVSIEAMAIRIEELGLVKL